MNIIFIIITLLWLIEFIVFPSKDKSEKSKASSFSLILVAILSIVIINGACIYYNKFLVFNLYMKIIALFYMG